MPRTFEIEGRRIGEGEPVFVVAEMSANHNGSYDEAVRILEAAKEAGADAVKLQTYTPDTMTIDCDAATFVIDGGTPWDGETLYRLYGEALTPWDWHPKLAARARDLGLVLFSSPFDATAVEFLESMEAPLYKVASFEIVDVPLLERVAQTGKPVICSTGMATEAEIALAVGTLRAGGTPEIVLLKCTSAYPAPADEMNLRAMADLPARFDVLAGLSDHTLGPTVPVAATALGAVVIEKHFTRSRNVPGPDAGFSLEPTEFAEMVRAVRTTEAALGTASYGPTPHERPSIVFRRSLYVVEDVAAGEPLTPENVRSIRPGHGLAPRHLREILGRRAAVDIARGTPLAFELLRPEGHA
jgi:N-acetylneuraminate synthase